MRAHTRRWIILLGATALIFALAGVGLLLAYLSAEGVPAFAGRQPKGPMRDWVPAEAIDERLSLLWLAGGEEREIIDQALAEGEPDTALAVAVESIWIEDRVRAGLFLRLADAYLQAGRREISQALIGKAETIAVLSPELSDLTRAELLVQAGTALERAGARGEAVGAWDQAVVLIRFGQGMRPAQRQQLADLVRNTYRMAGVNPPTMNLPEESLSGEGERPHGGLGAHLNAFQPPADVRAATEARQNAARALWEYQESHPGERPAAYVGDLADALRAEEATVQGWLVQEGATPLERAQVELSWLAVKSWVADGKAGFLPVEAWGLEREAIDAALGNAWRELMDARLAEYQAQYATDEAEMHVLRWQSQVLAGELGLIPTYDAESAVQELESALDGVRSAWRIDIRQAQGAYQFQIQAPE